MNCSFFPFSNNFGKKFTGNSTDMKKAANCHNDFSREQIFLGLPIYLSCHDSFRSREVPHFAPHLFILKRLFEVITF